MGDTPRIFPKGGRPQGLLGFSQVQPEMQAMVGGIFSKYPALAKHQQDYAVFQGRPMTPGDPRQLESYPPEESWNPIPGKATTELYNTAAPPAEQQQMVAGDMLHHLPSVDPNWAAQKSAVLNSLTPEQASYAQSAYERSKANGDPRSFEQFLDSSWGDEFLMGYITPDAQNDWQNFYTPEQRQQLEAMRMYLMGGK